MRAGVFFAVLTVAAAAPAAATHPAQSGPNGDCLDFLVLNATTVRSPRAAVVTVHAGSRYATSAVGGDEVHLDFFDASGAHVAWNVGAATGDVPATATTAAVCVLERLAGSAAAYVPAVDATWTYEDGL